MHSLISTLAVFLAFTTACVNERTETSEDVRERYVDRHADTFLLSSRPRTLDALKSVLFEEGYELVPTERDGAFRSDTKVDGKEATLELSIHLLELDDHTMLVQVMELRRDGTGEVMRKTHRTDLEWLVAQRAEPDRALALMRKANDRADKVPPITRKK